MIEDVDLVLPTPKKLKQDYHLSDVLIELGDLLSQGTMLPLQSYIVISLIILK